ncbi:MAG: transcription-repair coupling factor [Bacteroidetes bacterium]|nr:transcription-repair coupling factor [Bacteroidota bacterium]MBK8486555.1 transcription-repair coupling factor [Bacteroidota bacterium]MBP9705099.1 transcription-repair coupling factor [Chitinophagales bacterium]
MDLENLISRYTGNDVRVNTITEQIENTPGVNIHLKGIAGSAASMILTAVFKKTSFNHIVILNTKEDAAYFLNDMESLLQKKDILFFPDSFKKPGAFDEVDPNNILQRTEVINKLTHSTTKGELIITYPEALPEKAVLPAVLKSNTLHVKKDESLDIHFILDVLADHGFEYSEFVFEPGQYSLRGGILDIFSFGNDLPYRIELEDDKVESIRVFEPGSQLSVKNIAQITIVPNMQTQFDENEKASLFKTLPSNTIIWFKDVRYIIETANKYFEDAADWFNLMESAKHLPAHHPFRDQPPAVLLENATQISEQIMPFAHIEFGLQTALDNVVEIICNTQPQPLFSRNFNMLIEQLEQYHEKKYSNYLFVSNAKQAERFHQIFTDLKANMQYTAIVKSISAGFVDHEQKVLCFTDHEIFERFHKYSLKSGYSREDALTMRTLRELQPGDFVTHIDHGVGIYSGLEKLDINGQVQEAVRLRYRDNDLLYVNINSLHKISRYAGKDATEPKLNKLGSDAWENLKRKTKTKVKDIAKELIALYAKRKASKGFAFSPDGYMQNELEASFIYEDTPDQEKATVDVKKDMERKYPMDRLVCGDVGFGKTEIAIRAAFKSVTDGKQVAILVPTTILALQHYKTFAERLKDFPVTVDYINRFKSAKEKKETLLSVTEGKTDILIGTHSIIGKNVKFKDLGLLIIDEEQKFGVAAKEKLRALRAQVDTLTLTATPIPRTLQFSMMGARDLSIINTPPPNRQPITTELKPFDAAFIRDAIYFEVYRNGQVFFVHNRVRDIEEIATLIRQVCPDISIGVAHGQLSGDDLEDRMLKFINHEFDVLVCTNIVESGLDIPNANTIIINNAHWFGLSDLHQLRGRVGRSNKKAYCYLLSPPLFGLPDDAKKRLRTIEQYSDLGSGFQISMRDMDIRGAGNLLGAEQSGFIADIGFDAYHKILDEAIRELKHTEYKKLFAEQIEEKQDFVTDVTIETDQEMLIPDEYINSVSERMSIYTRLDNVKDENGIKIFREELQDRFGPIPTQINELFSGIQLRWVAKELGFEKIIFKHRKLRCYFPENQQSYFYESPHFHKLLAYFAQQKGTYSLKQTNTHLILIMEHVQHLAHAKQLLEKIQKDLEGVN